MDLFTLSSPVGEKFTPKYCGIGTYQLRVAMNQQNIFYMIFRLDLGNELISTKKVDANFSNEKELTNWLENQIVKNETKLFQHLAF
jgi:hypothetical protein